MSYIIKSTSPFISIKLTEKGRENLAKGQLTFNYFGIGDSEINYDREAVVDANPNSITLSATSKILRPFDRQPNIKTFITKSDSETLQALSSSNINVVKAIVNNEATERGFFTGSTLSYTTLTGSTYLEGLATVSNTKISGGTTLLVSSATTVRVGDFVRLKLNTSKAGITASTENTFALPNLWYKIQSTAITGTEIALTVDRTLPKNNGQTGSSYVFVYKGGEVADSFGQSTSTAYWDSGTLSFDSATNITCNDVKIWNMNNVWCENIAGITGLSTTNLYENYKNFGSYSYLGTKYPFLEYMCTTTDANQPVECNGPGYSYMDMVSKSISILHYTNNTISNLYGEFFYLDPTNSKTLTLTLPDLMYHKAKYATSSGVTIGMSFIASGISQTLGTSDIEYFDLYEDPTLVDEAPIVVGKVFPQLKLVTIEDNDIVAAMSYKSNRNWTLPALSAVLSSPTGGTSTGILDVNKTIYITYQLDGLTTTGMTTTLPCQYYTKVTNNASSIKDVSFTIEGTDLLPYMRKIENGGYDGLGFYAYKFKVLYQIVDDINTRPDAGAWKVYDFTSTAITTNSNETIDPKKLEIQSPTTNGFVITSLVNSSATTFDITQSLSMPTNSSPETLQFGDERFFYGNLSTYIGATIYKTLFDIRISAADFVQTTNPTRGLASTNPASLRVSEVGIYDSNKNLVVIGKLSEPVLLDSGNTIMLELSMDF